MNTKHTPGPWQVRFGTRVTTMEELDVALCYDSPNRSRASAEANARLIAKAPELEQALRGILEIGKRDMSNPKYDGYFDSARALLAEIEGGEK